MAQREKPGTVAADATSRSGGSALRAVIVGAAVAFGGYAAYAGVSTVFGSATDAPAASKPEVDCASSRFAWRPECRPSAKTALAAADEDKSRRTRRRSTTSAASEPAASPTIASLSEAALAEASVEARAGDTPPEAAALVKQSESSGPVQIPAPVIAGTPVREARPAVAAPRRERRAAAPVRAEPETPAADEVAATVRERPRETARGRRIAARANARKLARRDAARFASLPAERGGRRAAPAEPAWDEAAESERPAFEESRRSGREARMARRDRGGDRLGLPPGMTATTVRTYQLPDGRLVSVRVKPRAEEVRELVSYHRAHAPRMAWYAPW